MIYLNSYSYNVGIAKIFGVCSSIFLTCLQDEYDLQLSNKKLNLNNTMSISRQAIYDRTGLDDDKQKEVESSLIECGVLTVKPLQNVPNKNYYVLNTKQLDKIISAPEPIKVIENENAIPLIKKPRVEPQSKRKTMIANLKGRIKTESPIIRQYMCDWIDSVYVNPKGFMSPSSLNISEEELNTFTKGDEDKQIEILKIAIKNGWRDISWAIKRYVEQNGSDGISNNFVSYNDIKSDGTNVADEAF